MTVNRWRWVRYADDGVDTYQWVHAALAELRRFHREDRTTRIEYRASIREKERGVA